MNSGVKYTIIASLMFAFMQACVKIIPRIPIHEIVFFRGLIGFVVCYIILKKRNINPFGHDKKNLILRGLTGTIALFMFFYTLHTMPLASAATIQYLAPIFTILIAGLMLKEPAQLTQWLFFILAFVGVALVKGFDPRITGFELAIGMISAFLAAYAYNLVRKLKDTDHTLVIVFYFPLVTLALIGPYTLFNFIQPTNSEWLFLILVGIFSTIAQVYLTKAYHAAKAANIAQYYYLGVIYALAIGYFLFDEKLELISLLGIILIIVSILMLSYFRKK